VRWGLGAMGGDELCPFYDKQNFALLISNPT